MLLLNKLGGRIDALLTDIRLPGNVDGWALGKVFSQSRPHGSVIYVSGIEPDQAQREGNTLFLQKPVHVSHLMAALRRIR